jgi:hypothetical protein
MLESQTMRGGPYVPPSTSISGGPFEGAPVDAMTIELLQIVDRRHHIFTTKSAERPEQHYVELAPTGVLEQLIEPLALVDAFSTALVIDVLTDNLANSALAPGLAAPFGKGFSA